MRDRIAEWAVLGSVMLNTNVAGPALLALDANEFAHGRERQLAALLIDLMRKSETIDPVIVATEAVNRGMDLPATWLFDVQAAAFDPRSAEAYAARVRECFRIQSATGTGRDLNQRLAAMSETGQAEDFDTVLGSVQSRLGQIPEPLDRTTAEVPPTLEDLLALEPTYDWLIPHLLERSERLMVTGEEGLGKSMFLRQIGACAAAGVHPFTGARFGSGLRVLHVDAENGVGQSRRAYSRIAGLLGQFQPDAGWRKRLMIVCRPDGLELTGDDQAWWERTCAAAAPDVIITGPVYRLAGGNPNAEEDVRNLVHVLDKARVRHNAALILEAHAGHGSPGGARPMRPAGASLWRRWPENGLGLVRGRNDAREGRAVVVDVVPWRMSREERAWPDEIEHGFARMGQLPWRPSSLSYDGRVNQIDREESA